MKIVITTAGLLGACFALTHCVAVIGTPDGIKAYGDMENGLVVTGKAKPNVTDTYFQTRQAENAKPSWIENLFPSQKRG